MRFRVVIIFVLIIISTRIKSQSINSMIVNVSGVGVSAQSNYSLAYSVGELASIVTFIGANNISLSTGLLQTFIPLVTGINDMVNIPNASVAITPNPTSHYIQIQTRFNHSGTLHFQLLDAQSKIVYHNSPVNIYGDFQKTIDLIAFPSGLYYLQMQFQPTQGQIQLSVYKIIKL